MNANEFIAIESDISRRTCRVVVYRPHPDEVTEPQVIYNTFDRDISDMQMDEHFVGILEKIGRVCFLQTSDNREPFVVQLTPQHFTQHIPAESQPGFSGFTDIFACGNGGFLVASTVFTNRPNGQHFWVMCECVCVDATRGATQWSHAFQGGRTHCVRASSLIFSPSFVVALEEQLEASKRHQFGRVKMKYTTEAVVDMVSIQLPHTVSLLLRDSFGNTEGAVIILNSGEHTFCMHAANSDSATLTNLTTWSSVANHNVPWTLPCPSLTWGAVPLGDYMLLFFSHDRNGNMINSSLMVRLVHVLWQRLNQIARPDSMPLLDCKVVTSNMGPLSTATDMVSSVLRTYFGVNSC